MAPRVREICERHGLAYHTGSFGSQFVSAMRRLCRFALPGKPSTRAAGIPGEIRVRGSSRLEEQAACAAT
jgi:hypothetical protein